MTPPVKNPPPNAAALQAKFQQALSLHQMGMLSQAQALYEQVLKQQPQHFDALHFLGIIAYQTHNPQRAVDLIRRAIEINPDSATAHINLGNALQEINQIGAALQSHERAIALRPDHADAYYNRGNALAALNQPQAALASYDRAIALKPDHADAYYNRGLAQQELKQLEAALAGFDRAIALVPDHADAYNNRGLALHELKHFDAALVSFDRAIALAPDIAEAHYNRGRTLAELKQLDAAIASYDRALALKPEYAEAYQNRGNALRDVKRIEEALESYGHALKIKPDSEYLYGLWLHTKMLVCDWSEFESNLTNLSLKIRRNEKATPPFPVLALTSSLSVQRKAAEIWVNDKCPANADLPAIPKHGGHQKIRIGYYSADFHDHATAYLMAEMVERHDRDRFELFAFSFGPDNNDEMRKRLIAAFDPFMDVRSKSDKEVALLSRSLEIDIAVDLKGFTQNDRTGIFSYRAAPVQVSYIGYPGTMGADYIDYLIADKTLIPEACRQHYSEKIVSLPNSYQVNDRKRAIAANTLSREALGLPGNGFVFCCFNNSYKITPATFDVWMRLLKRVEGSILWLFEDNPTASRNLGKEAQARGVSAERLIFAKRMPLAEHLARHRAADLFLDTLPYNAHTTASDALWAGLPVLTCMGEAFASRVAASLLNAIDLPELITTTPQQYEALAVELATHPQRLQLIKQKLARNRLTTPLFDTERFTRHIEAAYTQMVERYQAGLPPEHIDIAP